MNFHLFDTEKVLNNIINIITKDDKLVPYQHITFNHDIFIDGQKLSKRCAHRARYKCPNCEKECIIRLATLSNKLKKGYRGCKYCFHQPEEQITNPDMINVVSQEYFKKELTFEEFERVKQHIISFQNKFTVENFTYIPIVQRGNEFKSMLYDNTRKVYEEIVGINCKCEQCDNVFKIQFLHELKNQFKILCNECKRIKSFKFGVIHGLIYKNKFEKKFIEMCFQNGIKVENKDGKLYILELDKFYSVQHKKFKTNRMEGVLYSDELVEQINIIKKQINENNIVTS